MGFMLNRTTPQSAVSYFSSWKKKMELELGQKVEGDLEIAYSSALKSCEKDVKPHEQVAAITLETFQTLDKAATSQEDLMVLKAGMMCFWLMLRMEELGKISRDDFNGKKT